MKISQFVPGTNLRIKGASRNYLTKQSFLLTPKTLSPYHDPCSSWMTLVQRPDNQLIEWYFIICKRISL